MIAKIVNMSITLARVPHQHKVAFVKPLLKKPTLDHTLKNYRPVSNLSFISKLVEGVVNKQLNEHLDFNNLSEPLQSAYKSHHSTETALIKVFDDVLSCIDKKNHAVYMALLDLSAAFDTVDHTILLARLEKTFGVTNTALEWFRSYLTGRSMKVCIDGRFSNAAELTVSVPQGSKLGPRLYSDYTQPLGTLIRTLSLMYHLYADDSQIITEAVISSAENQSSACESLQSGIAAIQNWMNSNRLKLNPDKTEFIIITSARNMDKIVTNTLDLGDYQIKRASFVRNLGVIMDSSLNMEEHVLKVCQVCYFYISWVRKIRHILDETSAKAIIHALVISRLDYCNALLAGLPDGLLQKLQRVMNTAGRVVTGFPRDSSASNMLKHLHWLPIKQRVEFKVAVMVFRATQGSAPQYICDLISACTSSRNLRSQANQLLHAPRTRTRYGDRAFSRLGPRVWNNLPVRVRQSPNEKQFRKALKCFLFQQAFSI